MSLRLILLIFVLFIGGSHVVLAKEKKLGVFGTWEAYSYQEGGQTVCYMVTTKLIKSAGPAKRATPYLMLTDRPTEASKDVISYGAGTNLNSRRGVKIRAGKDNFEMFSVKDTAWLRDSQTDHKVAAQIKALPSLQVSAVPEKKGAKPISDTFDLKGAPLAYNAVARACGLLDAGPKKTLVKKKSAPVMIKTPLQTKS